MKILVFRASLFSALIGAFLQTFMIYWSWMSPSRVINEFITAFVVWFMAGLIFSIIFSKHRKLGLMFDVTMVVLFCSIYLWTIANPHTLALPFWLAISCSAISIGTIIFTRKSIGPEKTMAIISFVLSVGFMGLFMWSLLGMISH